MSWEGTLFNSEKRVAREHICSKTKAVLCACVFWCMYVVCVCVCVCLCVCFFVYVCVHMFLCVCMYWCLCVCVACVF